MDFEAVRAGLEMAVPFNSHLGLRITGITAGRGVVALPDRAELRNHVGTQHAGGLFAAGEAASGAAFVSVFADRLAGLTPLAERADIAYRRLARGEITATAHLRTEPAALFAALDAEGVVRFDVPVELTDATGGVVAEMVVHWHVRARDAG